MGKQVWRGEHLWNLLNLPIKELQSIYPDYTKGGLKGKKQYWTAKYKRGEIEMPPKPEREPVPNAEVLDRFGLTAPEGAVVNYHIGYIKNAAGEIEYTDPLPSVHVGHLQRPAPEFDPAVPARITPTKRKPVERDHRVIYVFSDAQIDYRRLEDNTLEPIHDERALEAGRLLCADLRPDFIVNLGDTVDLSALSRFKLDSDHFHRTLGPSFQRVHDYYAQLRADNPQARIVEIDSNHNTRLKDFMLKNAPQLYGVKQAGATEEDWPVFSYPYLANLNHVQVEWVSGYGSAQFVYGEEYPTPPIVFKHGNSVVSNGSTSAKESKENPEVHVVRGHSHRMETHYRTTRQGHYLGSFVVGASCRTTGEVPSYHSAVDDRGGVVHYQENWQTGVMVIYDYDGVYQFVHVPIIDGEINYNGRTYSGNE